jgi:hypothetical protein
MSLIAELENNCMALQQHRDKHDNQRIKQRFSLLEDHLLEVENQRESELKIMRRSFEEEKEVVRDELRRRIFGARQEETEAEEVLLKGDFDKAIRGLKIERKELAAAKSELETMIVSLKEENHKQMQVNEDIHISFVSLSAYVTKKSKENNAVEAAEKAYADSYRENSSIQLSPKLKQMYRGCLYKCADRIQAGGDDSLYKGVKYMICACDDKEETSHCSSKSLPAVRPRFATPKAA